jgi:hypothetical protein
MTRLGDPDSNRFIVGVDMDRNLVYERAASPE